MKYLTLALYSLICFASHNYIIAQGGNPASTETGLRIQSWLEHNLTIPTSPQAATMGEYGNVEISPYTGSVQFDIPIHTVKGNYLTAPISLSYNSGGNKVSDLPTWVGIGWNLQAGGVVTRATQGDPDYNSNYYSKDAQITAMRTEVSNQYAKYDLMEQALRFQIETQPDIYYFNFPGYSGKFYILPNKQVIFKEITGLNVTVIWKSNGDIDGFTFTDNMGLRYLFVLPEETRLQTDDSADGRGGLPPKYHVYNSAWHLREITTTQSTETLIFEYSSDSSPFYPLTTEFNQETYTYPVSTSLVNGSYPCGNPNTATRRMGGSYSLLSIVNRKFLSKIILKRAGKSLQTIQFYSTEYSRTWGNYTFNNRKLDSIGVSDNPNEGGIERLHHFSYYPFCTSNSGSCASTVDRNRLTLSSYTSPNLPSSAKYTFTYNSTSLPEPHSKKVDHWGFYNDNSGSSMVPTIDLCGRVLTAGGADRETSSTRVKAGILEKISYPTGGYTELTWEPHKVPEWRSCSGNYAEINGAGVRIKFVKNFKAAGALAFQKEYRYVNNAGTYTSAVLMTKPNYVRQEYIFTSLPYGFGGGGGGQEPIKTAGGKEPMRTGGQYSQSKPPKVSSKSLPTGEGPADGEGTNCEYATVNSSSLAALGSVQGSYVGYSRVEEINAGKRVYHYSNTALSSNQQDEFLNGKLIRVEDFNSAGKLVAAQDVVYSMAPEPNWNQNYIIGKVESETQQTDRKLLRCTDGGSTTFYWVHPQLTDPCVSKTLRIIKSRLKVKTISLRGRSVVKASENTTQYFYNSSGIQTGSLSRQTTYEYTDTKSRNPTSITVIDSKGEVRRTDIRYASGGTTSSATAMVLNRLHDIPIVYSYKEGSQEVHRAEYVYEANVTAGGLNFKDYLNSFSGNSLRHRERIDARDAHGNPTHSTRLGNVPTAYIWGGNGTTMVAAIQNALPQECAYTSFEQLTDFGGWYVPLGSGGVVSVIKNAAVAKVGEYVIQSGTMSKTGLPAGMYLLSLWTKTTTPIAFTDGTKLRSRIGTALADGYVFHEYELSIGTGGKLTFNLSNYTDEVRLHPIDALMQTFAYRREYPLLAGTGDQRGSLLRYDYNSQFQLTGSRDIENFYLQTFRYDYAAPTVGTNTITAKNLLVGGKLTTAQVDATAASQLQQSKSYVDGLGRPIQTSLVGESPTNKDVVTFAEFDGYGRQEKQFLPYTATTNGGAYRTAAAGEQSSFYTSAFGTTDGDNAFTYTQIEVSPLARPLQNSLAGDKFQLNPTKVTYRSNTANEVRDFRVTNSFYAANTLLVIESIDGDGRQTRQFLSKTGRKLREDRGAAKTYYLYDGVGNVVQVIPPMPADAGHTTASLILTSTTILNNSYRYTYNGVTNLLQSTFRPGEKIGTQTTTQYDRLERPVLITSPNNTGQTVKEFTKYDILSRPIMTGVYTGTASPSSSDALYETKSTAGSYGYTTTAAFPKSATLVYTVQHYDNYDKNGDGTEDFTYSAPSAQAANYEPRKSIIVRGLPTVSMEAVLPANSTTAPTIYLTTASYYDNRGRIILTDGNNHLSGTDKVWTRYNFAGWMERSRRQHATTAGALTINKRWTYDHRGRVLKSYHTLGDGTETEIASSTYDEWSRLKTKGLAKTGSVYAQNNSYAYTINGWLKALNNVNASTSNPGPTVPVFAMQLNYDVANTNVSAPAQYTGNISSMEYAAGSFGASNVSVYGFTYDDMSRLAQAKFADRQRSNNAYINADRFSLSNVTYDLNGNIKTLKRRGKLPSGAYSMIDDLYFSLGAGGQFDRITYMQESADKQAGFKMNASYAEAINYNDRGSVVEQGNLGITGITYNHLNLPVSVTNHVGTHGITYSASGTKLYQTPAGGGARRDYFGEIEYRGQQPSAIYHEEGRAVKESGVWKYEYVQRDHLGNTRITFRAGTGGAVQVQSIHDYYPFGMVNEDRSSNPGSYAYRYNGKELNEELGLYDYGARWYDPSVGRFTSIDPFAEKMPNWSPYTYSFNNPLRFTDPDGRMPSDCCGGDRPFSAAGIIYEGYQNARAGIFNMEMRVIEYFTGTESGATRMRVNYNSDGTIPYDNPVTVSQEEPKSAGAETVDALLDAAALTPLAELGAARGISAPFLAAKTPGLFAALARSGQIDASSVRFSQSSIGNKFQDGTSVSDLAAGLKDGSINPASLPAIRIVEKDGNIFTLDNRRLHAFQEAGLPVHYEKLDAIPKRELFKFTTTNQGTSIRIRE